LLLVAATSLSCGANDQPGKGAPDRTDGAAGDGPDREGEHQVPGAETDIPAETGAADIGSESTYDGAALEEPAADVASGSDMDAGEAGETSAPGEETGTSDDAAPESSWADEGDASDLALDGAPDAADDASLVEAETPVVEGGSEESSPSPGDAAPLAKEAAPDVAAPSSDAEPDGGASCLVPAGAPTCVPHGPCATRADIAIRKVLDASSPVVRIAVDPTSHDIHYMDLAGDIFRLQGDQGVLAHSGVDVAGGGVAEGMAFGPDGTLYVVANVTNGVTFQAIIRAGVPDGAGGRTWSTLATTDPIPESNTAFDHHYNGIAASPDGQYVFVNAGSRTDHGELQEVEGMFPGMREVPLTSAIFRIPAAASGTVLVNDESALVSGGYLFADGFRNAFDPEFSPSGVLMAGDNGPDADYPEELNIIRQGAHYGFPWRLSDIDNPQRSPTYDPASDRLLTPGFFGVDQGFYVNDPTFPAPPAVTFVDPLRNVGPDGVVFRDPTTGLERNAASEGHTLGTFTPHRVPVGLAFDRGGVLCGDLAGSLFVLSFGADTPTTLSDAGRDLMAIHFIGDNEITSSRLVSGFVGPVDEVLVGDKLYVVDLDLYADVPSSIWEIALPRVP